MVHFCVDVRERDIYIERSDIDIGIDIDADIGIDVLFSLVG